MRDALHHCAWDRESRARVVASIASVGRESEKIASENWVSFSNSLNFKLQKEFENVKFKRKWNAERRIGRTRNAWNERKLNIGAKAWNASRHEWTEQCVRGVYGIIFPRVNYKRVHQETQEKGIVKEEYKHNCIVF